MVQIGNFHIGRYDTAHEPVLSTGEAFALWDNLVARYDWDDSLEIYLNYAHDPDLQAVIEKTIKLLREQSNVIEKQLAIFKIPLPPRPRKIVNFAVDSGVVKDQFIFRRLFTGMQDFLQICSDSIKRCVVNDKLREIFIYFLQEKLAEFDELCLFGRKKGWLEIPPQMTIQ